MCDKRTKQPKQICRFDCKQLQQDICKNEYFNVKSLFESSKISDNLQQQSSNFMLDCNQLPPSSDSPSDCLPIVTMTLDKLESQVIAINNHDSVQSVVMPPIQHQKPNNIFMQDQCINGNGIDYRGIQSFTRNGYQCQKWSEQFPHAHNLNSQELSGHNYCRNLDNDVEPWCFTTNPQQRKDYCNIPKCKSITEDKTDYSSFSLKNYNLLYIIVPSVSLALVFILLTFCFCRRNNRSNNSYVTKSINGQTAAMLNGQQQQPPMIQSSVQPQSLIQQQSRLRMSNVSIGKKQNNAKQQNCRAGSSKSSVASSANNHNMNQNNLELNPFLKQSYEANPMLFNFNHQQQQYIIQQQQQQTNEYNNQLKHVSPNNIRYLQEIGKGRFGPVYVGELVGTYASNSVVKTVIKTLSKPAKRNLFADELNMQTTSTPNVNACYQNNTDSAAAHFNEQEFYNEISLYSALHNRYLTNLIGVHTTKSEENDDDCVSILDNNSH